MLKKGAIYPLEVCTTLAFCSRLFHVPKPGKKWRPVIDLSVLNRFLHVPTFKMETAEIIRNSLSNRLRVRHAQKRGYLSSRGMHNSSFLQQVVSCTKTWEKMASSDRPQCPEQVSACSYIQNGNCRDYPKFAHERGMASVHRSEGCVLSRSHTSGFSTLASFPCRQANVSVQSSSFRVGDSTPRVHVNRTRSKTCSSVSRNSSSPVSRRLVKSKYQAPMSDTDKRTHSGGARSRLCDKL